MTKLSDKLADLSVLVGDVEARAEAFTAEHEEKRARRVAALKADVLAQHERLREIAQSRGDEIASAWAAFNQSMRDKSDSVRAEIEAKMGAFDANRAARHAEQLEFNAGMAVDFARVAMQDAELAVAQAINARQRADASSSTSNS